MATVYIFHGYGGNPAGNWFPWLKKELEKVGHTVHVPAFPNPDSPDLSAWLNFFESHAARIDEATVFVGHSLGSAFAMRYLEKADEPIQATFLTAPVFGVMGNEIDAKIRSFNIEPFDFTAIARNGGEIHVIHSDNDPYIPLSQAENGAIELLTPMDLITGGGHFMTPEFPELRDMILTSVI